MGFAYLVVAVVAAAVAVFALQNGQPTPLRFLGWTIDAVPVAGAVLGALVAGLVVAGVPLSIERWRWRSRTRSLEKRVAALERTVEAQRPVAAPAPTPAPAAVRPPAREA
jgi:putative membrane protein